MSMISHLWNIFVQGNFLNFTLFLLFFAWVFKKIQFGKIIESLQTKIVEIIESTKKNKADAAKDLANAKKAIANIEEETEAIVEDAKKSAKVISEKIKAEAVKQVESIEQNSMKIINAEEKKLVSMLTRNTSHASVQVAKSQIVKALEQNPGLHERYINESIDELDRLNF